MTNNSLTTDNVIDDLSHHSRSALAGLSALIYGLTKKAQADTTLTGKIKMKQDLLLSYFRFWSYIVESTDDHKKKTETSFIEEVKESCASLFPGTGLSLDVSFLEFPSVADLFKNRLNRSILCLYHAAVFAGYPPLGETIHVTGKQQKEKYIIHIHRSLVSETKHLALPLITNAEDITRVLIKPWKGILEKEETHGITYTLSFVLKEMTDKKQSVRANIP